ncbi:MAG: nucleotide exchange factor GrpE [Prevotellaceae bacterium]|jgi:grpE|nr:nucleotide exchange factor GrpE [Bacteroidaceae bacterium]MCI6519243.1 nucleotide exchange factor GrpE [Prevotellaceae bacterium]MDD7377191.1 nucleotide exchange factor GrpE [Prevotellaceae bacterium]MDY4759476.1 nucleotide exchange factor GrpE [Bacteroidaceae bacterium]
MSNKKNHKPEETQENQNTKNNAGEQANETVQEENNNNKQSTDTDKTAEYEATIADLKDKYLRQAAEFDNYRKRVLKEKSELIQNGGESVISSLLPIIDDFERALQNMKKSDDTAALKEGVELIYQKFMKTLESNGLKTIETKEADFNTDFHEAVAMIPAPNDESKGKVVDCVQKGYKLNDKVIRHAKVAVGQ